MKIIADSDSSAGTVKLSGEIDLCSVPELRDALEHQTDLPAVILDLSDVTFMDSSGLSIIIECWRRMQSEGHRLVVVGAIGEVLEIFRLTNLDKFIPLYATGREAHSALDSVA